MNESVSEFGKLLMILMVISFSLTFTQIIFDGFTVGRYDEGLDDNDFATDTSLMSASGNEACKLNKYILNSAILY